MKYLYYFFLCFFASYSMIAMQPMTDKQTRGVTTDLVASTSSKKDYIKALPTEICKVKIYLRLDEAALFGGLGCADCFFHTDVAGYSDEYYMGGERRNAAFNYIRSLGSFSIEGYDSNFLGVKSEFRKHLQPPIIEQKSIILSQNTPFTFSALATIVHNNAQDKSSIPLKDYPGLHKIIGQRFLIHGSCTDADTKKPNIALLEVQHMGGGTLFNTEIDDEVVYGVNKSCTQLLISSYQYGGNTDSDGGNNRGVVLHLISEKGSFKQKSWYLNDYLSDMSTTYIDQHAMGGSQDHLKIEGKHNKDDVPFETFFVYSDGVITHRRRKADVPMLGEKSTDSQLLSLVSHFFPMQSVEIETDRCVKSCHTACQGLSQEKPLYQEEAFTSTTTLLNIPDDSLIRHKSFLKFAHVCARCLEKGSTYDRRVVHYMLSQAHWSTQEYVELAAILYQGGDRHYSKIVRTILLASVWAKVNNSRQEINFFGAKRTRGLLWGHYYSRALDTTMGATKDEESQQILPLESLDNVTFEQEGARSKTNDSAMCNEKKYTPEIFTQNLQKKLDKMAHRSPDLVGAKCPLHRIKTEQSYSSRFSFLGTCLYSPFAWMCATVKRALSA